MKHGIVSTVTYEDGVVYCNVRTVRTTEDIIDVPVLKPHSGFIQLPSQGDVVMVEKLKDGTPFITNIAGSNESNPDKLKNGDLVIQLDDETEISFKQTDSGLFDVNISSSGTLSLSAKESISLDAEEGVFINGIRFSEHTHSHSWTDKSGSGETSGPN